MGRSRADQAQMSRASIIISGRVQGVYFRASARHVALAHRLSGWVRNRVNGDVEAVVEGTEDAVQTFIAWCHDGPPGAQVTAVQVTMEPNTGEFHGFRVLG